MLIRILSLKESISNEVGNMKNVTIFVLKNCCTEFMILLVIFIYTIDSHNFQFPFSF